MNRGKVVGLSGTQVLSEVIVGTSLEAIDSEALVVKYQSEIRTKVQVGKSSQEIAKKLHSDLTAAGVQHHTLVIDQMYAPNEQGKRNAQIWFESENIKDAKAKIKRVTI